MVTKLDKESANKKSLLYRFVIWCLRAVVNTFFRSVYIVGDDKFPKAGPAIVVANHSNQFVDGMMLQVHCSRPISFLIAEKSMHRPVIGDLARLMKSVPVVRRRDIAIKGKGTLIEFKLQTLKNDKGEDQEVIVVVGKGTTFQTQLQPGFQIESGKTIVSVRKILSDTECTIDEKTFEDETKQALASSPDGVKYRCLPKVDHSTMFSAVFERLEAGGCIGIFPEGTSTDHTKMLEFQAGVAIMALGAKAKGIDVKIQPVGLNYFHGHRWRSRVAMRFAEPISVPDEISELALTNKKEASSRLLKLIRESLETVTFQAPSYDVARIAHLCRDLYADGRQLSIEESVELSRRFALGYEKFRDKPDIQEIFVEVSNYHEKLNALHVKDASVRKLVQYGKLHAIGRILLHVLIIIVAFPVSLLGLIWILPIVFIAHEKAKKEMKTAKAGAPTTKVKGLDVVASKQVVVGTVLLPLFYILYIFIATLTATLVVRDDPSEAATIIRWVVPFGLVVGIPLYLQVGLFAGDRIKKSALSIRRIGGVLFKPSLANELKTERQELHDKILRTVNKYIGELNFPDRVLNFENEEEYLMSFTDSM